MLKSEIKPGMDYAVREKLVPWKERKAFLKEEARNTFEGHQTIVGSLPRSR